jgi:hypothetical protein
MKTETLYYFPVRGFMAGYKAGMTQEFEGEALELAKASGVWHSKQKFDELWEAHTNPKPETPEVKPEPTPEATPESTPETKPEATPVSGRKAKEKS